MNSNKITTLAELSDFFIYGDIEEVNLEILGEEEPSFDEYQEMDDEQKFRLNAAAIIKAFEMGRLHKRGYLIK